MRDAHEWNQRGGRDVFFQRAQNAIKNRWCVAGSGRNPRTTAWSAVVRALAFEIIVCIIKSSYIV